MNYQDYIDLGFERYDLTCNVTEKETGYPGYSLTYKLTKTAMIEVGFQALDKPRLFLRKKKDPEAANIVVDITIDFMRDLVMKEKATPDF